MLFSSFWKEPPAIGCEPLLSCSEDIIMKCAADLRPAMMTDILFAQVGGTVDRSGPGYFTLV